MKSFLIKTIVLIFIMVPKPLWAGSNAAFVVNGTIVRPSGELINSGVISFTLRLYDPNSNCLLWAETQNASMSNSSGAFSLVVGAGTRIDGGAHTLKQVFTNAGTLSSLSCGSGSTYTPTASEDRILSIAFNDGGVAVSVAPMVIKSAPFAMQADQVSGYGIMNLAKISGAGSSTVLTPFQFDFLSAIANPASVSSAPCIANDILKFVGGVWTCSADLTGGSPGDSSYAAKGVVQFNTDAATSGVIVAAGLASINTGIGANQIPKFDASANLGVGTAAPTSRLDVSGAITQRGMAAPAVSAAATGRFYFDSTSNKFKVSENAGAYADLLSGATSISGDVSGTSSTTSVDKIKGTGVSITAITSGNFLRYNGTSWVNTNLMASDIPAFDVSKITSGILPVANGGTGSSTVLTNGKVMVSAGGAITEGVAFASVATPSTFVTRDSSGNISGTQGAFTANIASPMITGGTTTTSSLTYKTTSGVGTTGADHIFQVGNNGATEAMRILNNGNVGIGLSGPSEKLEVSGNIRASGQFSTGSATITGGTTVVDWNSGNKISTDYNCASNFSFANLRDGGTYTLAVTDVGTTQCNFSTATTGTDSSTVSYRFKPANMVRTASSHTIYTLMRIGAVVYVSWASGF